MPRAAAILPPSLPPVGVNREQAAALIGVSATLFDRMISDGLMPDSRVVYGRRVWDVAEVVEAFRALPHRSVVVDAANDQRNPWDDEEEEA